MSPAAGSDVTAPLVAGYVSLAHAAGVARRLTLAYSNARLIWWPLAYLDLPLLWPVNAIMIVRHPRDVVALGVAAAQSHDPVRSAAAGPARAWPLGVAALAEFVVGIGLAPWVLATLASHTASSAAADALSWAVTAWFVLVIVVPLLTYAVPMLYQHARGIHGYRAWKTTVVDGRTPAQASSLGAWPLAGGGLRGTGDGFALIRALAAEARSHNRILVGQARNTALGDKYIEETGAIASQGNRRHLRWP